MVLHFSLESAQSLPLLPVSSAITGGRGLKRLLLLLLLIVPWGFVRHYWRTRIETASRSNKGAFFTCFVRHYWRTRIETVVDGVKVKMFDVSSAITGGRGLKQMR